MGIALSAVVALVFSVVGAVPAAAAGSPGGISVAEFSALLTREARDNPVAAESLADYVDLTAAEQRQVVRIVNDPRFALEFLDFAASTPDPTVMRPVFEDSALFAEQVEYQSSLQSGPGSGLSGVRISTGQSVGHLGYYPPNTIQTLRASSTAKVLGVTITRLNIWVTFKTGAQGIPKKAISSGSSASNFNFLIVITQENLKPYVTRGLAIAQTVWTGSVLIRDGALRFDKLDTLKAFSGGLYSHTLVNQ